MKPNTVLLIILVGAIGCQPSDSSQAETVEAKRVYVTNYPLYYMTERMSPPQVTVHFPVPNSQDPAFWQPPADTIAGMQQADLVITNGASYEKWLLTVSLPDQKVVNTSVGLQDQLLESDEVITHSHGDEGEHEHLGTAFTTWMNLELATAQAKVVRDALAGLMPEEEEFIEREFRELQSKLTGLHKKYKNVCVNISLSVAYSHPVYQYFQTAYQLTGPSLHWEPQQNLDQNHIHEFEHLLDHHQVNVLIWEAPPLSATIEVLEQMGVKSIVINPMGSQPVGIDFLEGLQLNLEQLKLIE